jgi:hypothetical protein
MWQVVKTYRQQFGMTLPCAAGYEMWRHTSEEILSSTIHFCV